MSKIEPKKTLKFKTLINRPGSLRAIGEIIVDEIIEEWKYSEVVELDFENETVASASLFDEIAKLYKEYPKEEVKQRLHFINIDPLDERLIIHLAKLRLEQEKAII
ncbi:MAG: STAS-like domain-containing protein [bacterium]|nr:STAS-like domain-containing protein [bacterium]